MLPGLSFLGTSASVHCERTNGPSQERAVPGGGCGKPCSSLPVMEEVLNLEHRESGALSPLCTARQTSHSSLCSKESTRPHLLCGSDSSQGLRVYLSESQSHSCVGPVAHFGSQRQCRALSALGQYPRKKLKRRMRNNWLLSATPSSGFFMR